MDVNSTIFISWQMDMAIFKMLLFDTVLDWRTSRQHLYLVP